MKFTIEIVEALLKDVKLSNLSELDRMYLNSMLFKIYTDLQDGLPIVRDYDTDQEDELDEHGFIY